MWLALAALLLVAAPCAAAGIAGQATVIDGDAIEIHGQRIRLHGVDAPESGQTCKDVRGTDYRCGKLSAFILADHIGRQTVTCDRRGQSHGRIVVVCMMGGDNLARWMVRQGQAVASRKYSLACVEDERAAQTAGLGIWRGEFVMPWDWRKGIR